MKIPLTLRKYSEGVKPYCALHFSYDPPYGRKSRGHVDAFVDTGSSFTSICQTDAKRLSLVPTATPRQIRIGGSLVNYHPVQHSSVKVICDDKTTIYDVSIPTVYVTLPIPNNARSLECAPYLPSIIGTDFLIQNKLALYFDPARGIAYLENPEK